MTAPTRTDVILASIEFERARQTTLLEEGRIPEDVADVTVGDETKLSVLMEEVGEVARELNEGPNFDRLKKELIQVAAVAVAWAESIYELQSFVAPVPDFVPVKDGVRGTE